MDDEGWPAVGPHLDHHEDCDGYLWLGTGGGLVRFDGVRFVTWEAVGGVSLPKVSARSLFISRDGTLWVGFSLSETAGIGRIRDGQLRTYGEREGLTPGTVNAIIEDVEGTIWAGTNTGLFRLRGDRWDAVSTAQGVPPVRVDSLYVDKPGDLLVGTGAGVFRKPSHAATFQQVDSPDDAPPSGSTPGRTARRFTRICRQATTSSTSRRATPMGRGAMQRPAGRSRSSR